MRVTNWKILVLAFSAFHFRAAAVDENWLILQWKQRVSESYSLMGEHVRRDQPDLFEDKLLNLWRFSLLGAAGEWTYQIGYAHVDFAKGADENRTHQFLFKNYNHFDQSKLLVRIGLEERLFEDDSQIYFRQRTRIQWTPLSNWVLSPTFYNELFLNLNGLSRFKTGIGENRFGLGARLKVFKSEVSALYTAATLSSRKETREFNWLQFQIQISLP